MKQEPSQLTANQINAVVKITSDYFGIPIDEITSPSRKDRLITPRHIAMSICRDKFGFKLSEIGHCFNRDHTTVFNATEVIRYRTRNERDIYKAHERIVELTKQI